MGEDNSGIIFGHSHGHGGAGTPKAPSGADGAFRQGRGAGPGVEPCGGRYERKAPSGADGAFRQGRATGQRLTPCERRYDSGSMSEPYSAVVRASKCRCGPVTLPVAPDRPICWPGVTFWPTETPIEERWPYWV